MLVRRPDGRAGFYIHLPLLFDALQSPAEALERTAQGLAEAEFPGPLQQLVRQAPADSLIKRRYYVHWATAPETGVQPPWHLGRKMLIGDAAHGMPPFLAQGTNQGFEDAATIATALAALERWDDGAMGRSLKPSARWSSFAALGLTGSSGWHFGTLPSARRPNASGTAKRFLAETLPASWPTQSTLESLHDRKQGAKKRQENSLGIALQLAGCCKA